MRSTVLHAGFLFLALSLAATGAKSEDAHAKRIACYKKDFVPATYNTRQELVTPATRKYVRRGQLIELWEYPPVYREIRTLKKDAHYVMREVACKN